MELDGSNAVRRTVTRDALRHHKRLGTLELYRVEITSGRTPFVFKATETNTETGPRLDQVLFKNFSSIIKQYGKNTKQYREPLEREFIAKGLGTIDLQNGGPRNTKYWVNATHAGRETAYTCIPVKEDFHALHGL